MAGGSWLLALGQANSQQLTAKNQQPRANNHPGDDPMKLTRRRFVQSLAATAGAAYLMPAASWARVRGANDRLVMGVIGTGGQGSWHTGELVKRGSADNVEIKRVCDVYRRRLNNAVKLIGGSEGSGTMEYR